MFLVRWEGFTWGIQAVEAGHYLYTTNLQRTQPEWSRRSAGDAPTERTSRRWRCFRGQNGRQERRRVQPRGEEGGATYSRSHVRVFTNRKPGLRLESGRIFEMDELVYYLLERKKKAI
jgi:hypothetical protein